jgi:hypothetical protein
VILDRLMVFKPRYLANTGAVAGDNEWDEEEDAAETDLPIGLIRSSEGGLTGMGGGRNGGVTVEDVDREGVGVGTSDEIGKGNGDGNGGVNSRACGSGGVRDKEDRGDNVGDGDDNSGVADKVGGGGNGDADDEGGKGVIEEDESGKVRTGE